MVAGDDDFVEWISVERKQEEITSELNEDRGIRERNETKCNLNAQCVVYLLVKDTCNWSVTECGVLLSYVKP